MFRAEAAATVGGGNRAFAAAIILSARVIECLLCKELHVIISTD